MNYIPKSSTIKIFTVGFPKELKDELAKLAFLVNPKFNYEFYSIPFISKLRDVLNGWMPNIVDVHELRKYSNDDEWLISFDQLDYELLAMYIRSAIISFFQPKIKKSSGEAQDTLDIILSNITGKSFKDLGGEQSVSLIDDNGNVVDDLAYRGFMLKVVNSLKGKQIFNDGEQLTLYRCGKNELMSQVLSHKEYYYAYVFSFSVQTLPKSGRAYLMMDISCRKFKSKIGGKERFSNKMSAYVKVREYDYQRVSLLRAKNYETGDWEYRWDETDKECYDFHSYLRLPNPSEILRNVERYVVPNAEQQILCTISTSNNYDDENKVGSGVTVDYKLNFYYEILKLLSEFAVESKNAVACKHCRNSAITKRHKGDACYSVPFQDGVRRNLAQNLNADNLTIEIYAYEKDKHIVDEVKNFIDNYLGKSENLDNILKVEVKVKDFGVWAENIKKNDIVEYRQRIQSVVDDIGYIEDKYPTCAIILLRQYSDKSNTYCDPKHVLRNAFAQTNRITQFINPDTKDEKEIPGKVSGAVKDLFRQCGLVEPHILNHKLPDYPIVAIQPISNMYNVFRKLVRMIPFCMIYEPGTSKIMVECPLLMNGMKLTYYKACIELARFSFLSEDADVKSMDASRKFIEQKMRGLENLYRDKPAVVVVNGSGILRKEMWPGITNKAIKEYRNEKDNIPNEIDIGSKKYPAKLDLRSSQLRILRVREGEEVPDYFTEKKSDKQYKSGSGIFKYDEVYYAVAAAPYDKNYRLSYTESKGHDMERDFKEKTLVEYYPIQLCDGDDAVLLINLVDELRHFSPQFGNDTNLPLPLHYLNLMDEYFLKFQLDR